MEVGIGGLKGFEGFWVVEAVSRSLTSSLAVVGFLQVSSISDKPFFGPDFVPKVYRSFCSASIALVLAPSSLVKES